MASCRRGLCNAFAERNAAGRFATHSQGLSGDESRGSIQAARSISPLNTLHRLGLDTFANGTHLCHGVAKVVARAKPYRVSSCDASGHPCHHCQG
jgi:hypothetical protein